MKKTMFVSALAGVLGFYACKKDDKTVTVTETVNDTIHNILPLNGKADPDVLTAAVTVAYGTKVADSVLPAATADASAPVLDTFYKRTYQAVEGSYLIIYPPNLSGNVAGYYVQIAGAKSYFKVDYPAAESVRKAARSKRAHSSARGSGDGYIDSAIVFKLPVDIKGDTFFVKYAAYDTANRVSKAISATVVVMPQGSAAFNDSLAGTWSYAGYREIYNSDYSNDWEVDTFQPYTYQYYTCDNEQLTQVYTETDIQLIASGYAYSWRYTFGKYSFTEEYISGNKYIDLNNSTCSNVVYTYSPYVSSDPGTYSYDPATRRLTIIFSSSASNIDFDYNTYYVAELTAHSLILAEDNSQYNDQSNVSLYKFFK